eukprot:COSAG02_NODE_609_length_19574_cov_18.178537_4_plen_127_part_00
MPGHCSHAAPLVVEIDLMEGSAQGQVQGGFRSGGSGNEHVPACGRVRMILIFPGRCEAAQESHFAKYACTPASSADSGLCLVMICISFLCLVVCIYEKGAICNKVGSSVAACVWDNSTHHAHQAGS